MSDKTKLQELCEAEDMAYFRGDLALSSPESYTAEEKRDILNEMIETTQAALDEMQRDFYYKTVAQRVALLDMLIHSGEKSPEWWWDVLVGEGDPLYRRLHSI